MIQLIEVVEEDNKITHYLKDTRYGCCSTRSGYGVDKLIGGMLNGSYRWVYTASLHNHIGTQNIICEAYSIEEFIDIVPEEFI